MSDIKGILSRLHNMKKLSERPGTPEEAAAAIAKMQSLMDKHNITEAELEAAGEIERGTPVHEEFNLGAALEWRRTILGALAKANNCAVLFNASGKGSHIFGKEANIAVATAMYDYLVMAVNRLADDGWEKSNEVLFYPGSARGWKHAFRVGAANTVANRIIENWQKTQMGAGRAGEIMVADLSDAEKMMRDLFNVRSVRKKMPTSSGLGLMAGAEAGRGVNLDAQVGGRSRNLKELGS